jgi:3-hydroxyisobutyrate dehydrogenase-like beta-hydroxyacid dehydrogenase
VRTVAILSPGDMGHAVGAVLQRGGLNIVTCLRARSERTRRLASEAGIVELADLEALVVEADIVLSILPPAAAHHAATELAAAIRHTGARPIVADCNAVAPDTVVEISRIIESAGGRFLDASIIGRPPTWGTTGTRIYVAGPNAAQLEILREHGLDVRTIGPAIGEASGLKMCYAAVTKGLTALAAQQQAVAAALGLSALLRQELELSQPSLLAWMMKMVPDLPPKAARWVGEMEEIAATFQSVGVPPTMMSGAAEFFGLAAATSLGYEVPDHRSRGESMEGVARVLSDELPR